MRQPKKNSQRVFLSHAQNRPYLPECPADIVSAAFYLDLKLQKKVMKLRIRNRSDRPLTALTILARYLDKNGHVIGAENGFIVLRFQGLYCAPHQTSAGSKTVILPYQDIAGIEAYITAAAAEDGVMQEFQVTDYILAPVQEMLDNYHAEADCRIIRARLGDNCVFIPQFSEDHWLCSCGAVAEAESCSACGLKQKNAHILASRKKTAAWLRSQRARGVILKIIPYAIALALFVGGVLVLRDYGIRYIEETLPADRLSVTRLYMSEHRYREALGYSVTKNHSLLREDILNEAVAYYCETGDFAQAAAYEQCRDNPDYEPIYESAARAFIAGTFKDCAGYALNVSDETLYNGVLRRLSEEAAQAGKQQDACSYALAMRGSEGEKYADAVLYDAITALLEKSLYEDAVAYISHLHDKSGVPAICRGIESELVARGKYEEAFTVASITGDASVFELAYPSAGGSTLRHYYDKFYPYMSASARREFLACELDAGSSVICITDGGKALDSERGILCENAISVSAGKGHVLVLQKDGTVRAFGDNTYGQCGCDNLSGAIAVAAGDYHSIVLMEDGTVRTFGDNTYGQCGVSNLRNVIAIAAGARHSVVLFDDGSASGCGSDKSGQIALTGYENAVGIAAGDYSTVLIFRDGSISVLGNIAIETFDSLEWEDVVSVAAGNGHLIALTSGGRILYAGTPGYAGTDDASQWSRVRTVACGSESVYAMDANGYIMFCGSDVPDPISSEWEALTQ